MHDSWRIGKVLGAALLGLVLAGCTGGDPELNGNGNGNGGNDQYKPCTDPSCARCTQEEMKCVGDPDKGVVCTCEGLWSCDASSRKCISEKPEPPGGSGEWECKWTEFRYECKKKGSKSNPPAGGSGWNCKFDGEFWKCTYDDVPNPSNKPGGESVWNCHINNSTDKIICTRTTGGTGGSNNTTGTSTGGGTWKCKTVNGKSVCQKTDDNGGLPTGGSNWKCNRVNSSGKILWVCYGTTTTGSKAPGGGSNWDCDKVKTEFGKDVWRCTRPEGPGDTPPAGSGSGGSSTPGGTTHWACARGTEFNGTKCVEVDKAPTPPTQVPKPGDVCIAGVKMWCDGLQYCGWGQVTCASNGKWPTVTKNGKTMLDCKELHDGRRPNTVCACYHYYFNPACCERPDCIVPSGSTGQICPKSAGGLCDYCNPQKPECKSGLCLVTNTMETFCGKDCVSDSGCPTGYKCVSIKNKPKKQCVPSSFSCYYKK